MPLSDIELEIRLLNRQKSTTHKNILTKSNKIKFEATVTVFHRLFDETIAKGVYLDSEEIPPYYLKGKDFDLFSSLIKRKNFLGYKQKII